MGGFLYSPLPRACNADKKRGSRSPYTLQRMILLAVTSLEAGFHMISMKTLYH